MQIPGLTFALLLSSVAAQALAQAEGPAQSRKSDWVVQNIHDNGWTFLGMYGGDGNDVALFVKPDEITSTSVHIKTLPIRFEFRRTQGRIGLSDRMVSELDCAFNKIHIASGTIYADNNFQGASHPADGWDGWRDSGPPGSVYSAVLGAVCAVEARP